MNDALPASLDLDAGRERAVTALARVLAEAFAEVHVLHDRVLELFAGSPGPPSTRDLAALVPVIERALTREGGWWTGMGYIAEPGVLSDQGLWLEWWQRPSAGDDLSRLRTDLRPDSLGFYDYPATEWFAVPRALHCPHMVGPYVDVYGTARYLLTLTEPVLLGDRFLGVVGADLPLSGLEASALPALAAAGQWAVVNAESRVVLATSSRWLTGARLPDEQLTHSVAVPGSRWSLVPLT